MENLYSLMQRFSDEEACRKILEEIRWKNGIHCPHCACIGKIYKIKTTKGYKCGDCQKHFSLTKGTIFERSHIPLGKWFLVMYLFSAHKKGLSSHQLSRDLGITQSTAWFMLHRVRKAMRNNNDYKEKLQGIVEVDETYVGGKNKNRHWDKKKKHSQGRSTVDKAAVFGMLSRGGKVVAFKVNHLYQKGMQQLIKRKVEKGSTVNTDEFNVYRGLNKHFSHGVVDHGRYQYCNGNTHTNSIEGFWSLLKRGIIGIYHLVSRKYLNKYCAEFVFRYNTRQQGDEQRFFQLIFQSIDERLSFQGLING